MPLARAWKVAALLAPVSVALGTDTGVTPTPPQRALAISPSDPALTWGPCPSLFTPGCRIAVLRGDPSQPSADALLTLPGGDLIPPHAHTSAERMVLLSGELEVRYKGHATVTLRAGDYAYGPPGLPHLGRCVSPTPCTLFIAFERAVDVLPADDLS